MCPHPAYMVPKYPGLNRVKEDFNRATCYLFSFFYNKITLFEKKYVIKLITLISMYHLKPLVSLQVHLTSKCRYTNRFLY